MLLPGVGANERRRQRNYDIAKTLVKKNSRKPELINLKTISQNLRADGTQAPVS